MNEKPSAAPEGEKTRSQKLREAGYTRRPTWKSLPKDGDDDAAPNLPDSETRESLEAVMALAVPLIGQGYGGPRTADTLAALRAAIERVIQERDEWEEVAGEWERNAEAIEELRAKAEQENFIRKANCILSQGRGGDMPCDELVEQREARERAEQEAAALRELLGEVVDLCSVGDVDESTEAYGWGDLIRRIKAARNKSDSTD